jgi:diguanylate cyclase (GGDEF)-like protein
MTARPEEAWRHAGRRRIRERGVLRASGGLGLLLLLILALDGLGVSTIDHSAWLAAAGVTLLVQGALWYLPRRGWDRALTWDPHYVRLPLFATVLLFGLYIHVAPEARFFLLMTWFVALLFAVGLVGLVEVLVLGLAMSISYLAAVTSMGPGAELSLRFEAVRAGVFLLINVFAGLVFERLKTQREETRELRSLLEEQAVTDPLTGLPNRRYLRDLLEAEIGRIGRYGGQCALAMIDVDDFKNYNDTLGHVAGDRVLERLGSVFEEHMRVSDVVARYGGEEFGLIMMNAGKEEALEGAERLRRRVEVHPFGSEEIQPSGDLTISVGVACCPEDAESYEELVQKADEALYAAKRRGKNRVHAA